MLLVNMFRGGSDGNTGLNETFLRQSGGTYEVRTAFGSAVGGVCRY